MQTVPYDITIPQGADWELSFRWLTGDGVIDLAGYSAQMQVRSDASSETVLLDLATGGKGVAIDESTGRVTVSITPAQLNAIRYPGARDKIWAARQQLVHLGDYDLHLISEQGTRTRMIGGRVYLSPGVTR